MVSSQFGAILKEFESFFNCPLEPDANDSCLITMGIGITLQIELDRSGLILMGCRLGTVHMGRYRDNLIREALKSNEATFPSTGVLGFSQKSNQLILFMKIDPVTFTIHQILKLLPPFVAKAKLWTDAIAKGEVPSIVPISSSKEPSGLFGLISDS
jgi:Tir chaperone protein (CesT) family